MKFWKILLFVFSVLAGLCIISIVMPEDGIKIGGVTLEYPSLTEVMSTERDTTPELSPEELMEQRLSAIQGERVEEFRTFCKQNAARIYLPKDNEAYLDPLFDAMASAKSKQMRIVHYGDSQLECDRISGDLRERFQAEFGGSGVGLVPALQTVATYSLAQSTSPSSLGHYLVYGPSDTRIQHSRYGVMGQMNRVTGGATITFRPRDKEKYPHAGPITNIVVMANGQGNMKATVDSTTVELTGTKVNDHLSRFTATLPKSSADATVSLRVNGTFDIYGIQLDSQKGVTIDNIPMRGCSGTIFCNIDSMSMAPFYKDENVKLIILQYGGNSVPSINGEKSIAWYMNNLRRQIVRLKQMAPKACMLFIGPADMATRKSGTLQTYPVLPQVIDSLREMSLGQGIAFWDMYAAMGGRNSIIEWNKARPQLAGDDYIHFTPKGAKKISDILYETLQFYYKFYRMRTGKENEALKQELDSIDNAQSKTKEEEKR